MLPAPFTREDSGAVWVRYGVSGYWCAWFLKQNTAYYLASCFDTESEAVHAAKQAYEMASH